VERDWTQPVLNPTTGLYDPKNVMGKDLTPAYRWWNGKLQKYPPGPLGSIADSGAKIFPWKRITTYVAADASSGALLPMKAGVYSIKGDLSAAVTTGGQQSGTPYSGSWTKVADELTFGVQHQVAPKDQALHCNNCHVVQGGRLDFAALGYSAETAARLKGFFDRVQFLSSRRKAGAMNLRWSATPGHAYQLQVATDLGSSASWVPLGPTNQASAVWVDYTVPASAMTDNAQLFFRVKDVQ
jgi:hypothetical protein